MSNMMLFERIKSAPVHNYVLLLLGLSGPLIQAAPSIRSISTPKPYTIAVDPVFIETIRQKAASFRPSVDIDVPAWFDGIPSAELLPIANYWAKSYNWSTIQAQINANFSHYTIDLPSPVPSKSGIQNVHFIHQRSAKKDAIPILMLHGWPSTSLEWEKVIPGLVHPENASHPSFHVVAPDIPGFGFSPAPTTAGYDGSHLSTLFASLMSALGYDRYAVYSTDLGFSVAQALVIEQEAHIINHVTDFYLAPANDTDNARYAANQTTPEETAYISAMNAWFANHSAYAEIHATFPLAIAHALNDSPVGFLGWMYNLVRTVSDQTYTAAEVITQALLLYIPGVYGNIRSYKELYGFDQFVAARYTTVPTSVLQFGGLGGPYPYLAAFNYVPRGWVERHANVTYFSRHSAGGHFPALSQPQLVLNDIRAIFA